VCGLEQDVSQALAKPYAEVCEAIPQQTRINADETGWTEEKSKAWLWVACASVAILFRIARSRGKAVAKELIGEGFAGILTTDRWSGYNWVAT
jgi:transposase